jgi:hypothetical protein
MGKENKIQAITTKNFKIALSTSFCVNTNVLVFNSFRFFLKVLKFHKFKVGGCEPYFNLISFAMYFSLIFSQYIEINIERH